MRQERVKVALPQIAISAYLILASAIVFFVAGDLLVFIAPFTSLTLALLRIRWIYPSMVLVAVAYISLVEFHFIALGLPVILIYPLIVALTTKPQMELNVKPPSSSLGSMGFRCIAYILPFTPTILLGLGPFLVYTLALSSLALTVLLASLRLEHVEVHVPKSIEASLGSRVSVIVRLRSPKARIRYWILLGEDIVARGVAKGEGEARVVFEPENLGLQRLVLRVIVEEGSGFAAAELGPYTIEMKVVSQASKVARLVEKIIGPLIREASLPKYVIVVGASALGPTGFSGGSSAWGAYGYTLGLSGYGRGWKGTRDVHHAILAPRDNLLRLEGSAKRGFRGDYWGVRPYMPGDRLRDIHWKKSISKKSLHVKEYSEEGEETIDGNVAIIIADLISSNPKELDQLILAVYASILSPSIRGRLTLRLRLPNGIAYIVSGRVIEVLKFWHELLRRGVVYTQYNYVSSGEPAIIESSIGNSDMVVPVKALLVSLERSISRLLEELGKAGIKRGTPIIIIHGLPTATLYTYLKARLVLEGFSILEPRLTSIEELTKRARIIASRI